MADQRSTTGWTPVTRNVTAPVLLDTAVERVAAMGFTPTVRNPGHAVLSRAGTKWTLRGDRFPIEMAIAEADDGLFVQLRYDAFVLADTGDLADVADEAVACIRGDG